MALKIRLTRGGAKKRPFYRIVVAEASAPRDGRYVERLGTYDPMVPKEHEQRLVLKKDRIKHWLGEGAKPTLRVQKMLAKVGLAEKPVIREQPKKSAFGKKRLEREEEAKQKRLQAAEDAKAAKAAANEARKAEAAAAKAESEAAKAGDAKPADAGAPDAGDAKADAAAGDAGEAKADDAGAADAGDAADKGDAEAKAESGADGADGAAGDADGGDGQKEGS